MTFFPEYLRPWQRMPNVACQFCLTLATRRVSRMSWEVTGPHDVAVGPDLSDGSAVLVCEEHEEQAMCRRSGVDACGDKLRLSWVQWLWDLRAPAKWLRRHGIDI